MSDVKDAVDFFLKSKEDLNLNDAPYFLWGRSAGAYISLLLSTMNFSQAPNGVISYYGYGFTVDNWFNTPSRFYLKYPKVDEKDTIKATEDFFIGNGHVYKRFIIYLYARQTGKWLSIFTGEDQIDFLNKYSLKYIDKELPPAFFAYSFKDNDVPFEESVELQKVFKRHSIFTSLVDAHDFDRDEKSIDTIRLLDKTLDFLNENI